MVTKAEQRWNDSTATTVKYRSSLCMNEHTVLLRLKSQRSQRLTVIKKQSETVSGHISIRCCGLRHCMTESANRRERKKVRHGGWITELVCYFIQGSSMTLYICLICIISLQQSAIFTHFQWWKCKTGNACNNRKSRLWVFESLMFIATLLQYLLPSLVFALCYHGM